MSGSLVCLGLSPPGARGVRVRCPGPTPALPVPAGRFVDKDSETGRGQAPGRGHSRGVQALLVGGRAPALGIVIAARGPPQGQSSGGLRER